MDQEQLEKKIDWLDQERRADKQTIASLQKRVAELEELAQKTNDYVQSLDSEITKTGVRLTKIDDFEEALDVHRKEVKKELDAQEKRLKGREDPIKKRYEEDYSALNKNVAEISQDLIKFNDLRPMIESNKEAIVEQGKGFDPLEKQIKEQKDALLDLTQAVKMVEEEQPAYKNRFTDIQGELAALRKRMEEYRGKYDLAMEAQKKLDVRINELIVLESERRDSQISFMDEINRSQLDVEKAFNEWSARFESIEQRAETLTTALQTYTEVERSLRKAQEEFDDISEKLSRRIHEITEMQRLGEERFRQEWTTFKSDDQKRWVNYTLTQEEQLKENARRFERLNDRTTSLEEMHQDLQDTVQHANEQIESLMQNLLGTFREWLTTNERFTDSV